MHAVVDGVVGIIPPNSKPRYGLEPDAREGVNVEVVEEEEEGVAAVAVMNPVDVWVVFA